MKNPGKHDFEKIINEHYPRLHRSISAYLSGSQIDAEDILQETFLKAWKNIDGFEGASNIYTWLYSIARNLCIDEFRKRKHENKISNRPVEEFTLVSDTSREEDEREDVNILKKAIESLPEIFRSVVIMKSIDGLTYPEISEITGINEQTLKNRMFRAKKQLAETLKKMGANP